MFDAYKVAVKLTLVNHVSAGLAGIATQLGFVNKEVKNTQAHFNALHGQLQKIQKMGLIGGAVAGAGFGMLHMLKAPLEEATQWQRIMASMKQKGLGDDQIADAQKFVRANDIYGVSLLERAKIFNEAQGSFRESGLSGSAALDAAKTMTPVLAGYKLAMATLDTKSHAAAEGSFIQLNKIVELMGGLGDSKRATEIVGGVFKAVQGSGKMISERDIRQFITYGGSAVSMLSPRMIFGALEPQMGEFGGSAMGTGMNTAYRLLAGMQSKPSKLFTREALRMGLWNKDHLVFNSQGGIKQYNGDPLNPEIGDLMRHDPLAFSKKLMGAYASQGITSQSDRERENEILLGRTGAKVYNKIMLQLSVMEHSLEAFDKAHGPTEVNAEQKNSIMQKSLELQKQWNDALLNFGLIAMPVAIKAIEGATWAITKFTDFAKENPRAVKIMTMAFIGLAGAMAFSGTVILLSAAFRGLALALQFGGVGGGVGGATGIAGLAARFGGLGGALALLTTGIIYWNLGSKIHEVLIAGTKFEDWLGSVIAHLMSPFSKEASDAVDTTDGNRGRPGFGGRGPRLPAIVDPSKGRVPPINGQRSVMDDYVPERRGGSPKMINNTIVLPDGKVLARVVTEEQAREAARPQLGTGRFDPGLMPLSPGMVLR